jgi:hypothetical protein
VPSARRAAWVGARDQPMTRRGRRAHHRCARWAAIRAAKLVISIPKNSGGSPRPARC